LAADQTGARYGGSFGGFVFKLTPPSSTSGTWTLATFLAANGSFLKLPMFGKAGVFYGYDVGFAGSVTNDAVYRATP
jgi:hypothetical protein